MDLELIMKTFENLSLHDQMMAVVCGGLAISMGVLVAATCAYRLCDWYHNRKLVANQNTPRDYQSDMNLSKERD